MQRLMNIALLFFLTFPAWAEAPGQTTVNRSCAGTQGTAGCDTRLPPYANPLAVAGSTPLSTGSSIGIASTTSESSVVKTIPYVVTNGISQGSGGHQASASLTGPGTVAAGGYTQSVADVKTSLFHLGYMTRITTDSINKVQDHSWATATSTGNGQTALSTTSSATSTTSASVSAGGMTAASSGRAASTATATITFSGPGTANVSATAWSNSASHAQVVLDHTTPVSSSASTINQSGGYSQASISNVSATQGILKAIPNSGGAAGAANMTGLGSSVTNRAGFPGRASGQSAVSQAAPHPGALGANPVTQSIMSGKSAPSGTVAVTKGK